MNTYQAKLLISVIAKLSFIKIRIGNQKSVFNDPNAESKIPMVVFQTTKSKWLPWQFWVDVKKLRLNNPELEFITFNQKDMQKWMKSHFEDKIILEAFNASKFGVVQSDIFKYCYAYKCGGISLDLSKYLSNRIYRTVIQTDSTFVLSQQSQKTEDGHLLRMLNELNLDQNLLINWCFATEPNNPALSNVISSIEKNYLDNKGKVFPNLAEGIWNMTGPIAFNDAVLRHFLEVHGEAIRISGIDFGEKVWPKFKTSSLVNVFTRHYTDETDKVIFK